MSNLSIETTASASLIQQAQALPTSIARSAYQQMADALQASPSGPGGGSQHGHHHAGGSSGAPDATAGPAPAQVTPSTLKIVA